MLRPPVTTLLGGLAPRVFLARHWQKRPLLVRGAWPGFADPVSVRDLFALATRDDCEARLVSRSGTRWSLVHAPLPPRIRRRLPAARWTLLLQGLNHFVPAADRILRAFAFVSFARLDDLMASYAVRGGGVGPHVDSYDVFLLQGSGRRRWRIAAGGDPTLDPRAPLRVLKRFHAQQEWVLEPGDMLYLPPGVAHEGTALEPCFTYSIGFRAPAPRELAPEFVAFLAERGTLPERRYTDPDLRPAAAPARIDDALVVRVSRMLASIRWSARDAAEFLGRYLSEPKPHVVFAPPRRALARGEFARALSRRGIALAGASGMLYRGTTVYINGESSPLGRAARAAVVRLANERRLPPGTTVAPAALQLFYTWYRAGYLLTGGDDG